MRKWIDLFEQASFDYDVRKAAAYLEQTVEWDGLNGEAILDDYRRDNGMDEDDAVDPADPEFQEWYVARVAENAAHAEYDIAEHIHGGKITIWRVITAPADWKPTTERHPGIHWSWDEDAAQAYWPDPSSDNVEWKLQATVPLDAIDWDVTMALASDLDGYAEEREIRLKGGYPIEIERYWQVV